MFSRLNRKQSAVPTVAAIDEDHFAQIIEAAVPADNVVQLPETRFGRALACLIRDRRIASLGHLDLIADLAKEVSETDVNAIWMAHNLREMTGASRAISGAVEELATSTSVIAESSVESALLAKRATDAIMHCAANAENATKAMAVIHEKTNDIDARLDVLEAASSQIGSMTTNIEAIAGRTNMLALNATIEAARAGDAGRGFVVVAGEVKALSQQTSSVTEEIRRRLYALAKEVAAIRVAVSESRNVVTEGQNIVHGVSDQVSNASTALNEVADRARFLADHLAHQRAATLEIADGTEAIAKRISKTESEVGVIDKRLAVCEKDIENSWDTSAIAVVARTRADVAAFKRKLAAILTGVEPPVAIPPWSRPGELSSSLGAFLESNAAITDLVMQLEQIAARSQELGAHVVQAVGSKDWPLATSFFEKCEEEVAYAGTLAKRLYIALKDAIAASTLRNPS